MANKMVAGALNNMVETYPAEIVKYYDLLDRPQPETARKICHDNILGLLKKY